MANGEAAPAPGRPGPAAGLDAAGPIARLWRSVYRKAAMVAEAKAGALLAQHVYHLHGVRAVAVVFDGGGTPLAAGDRCDLELPWGYVVEGWALYGDVAGALDLDVRACATYADYPAFASIVADAPPRLGDGAGGLADKGRDDLLEEWAPVAFPRGTVLRLSVTSNDVVTRATLTLYVRAF